MAWGSTTLVTGKFSSRTRRARSSPQVLRGRLIGVEQFDEIGRRRRRGDADELEVRRVAGGNLSRIERGVTALAMTPHGETVGGAGIRHSRAARLIEHRPSLRSR